MEWTYKISAAARPRVLMRIVQVFDQQMVSMSRCVLVELGGTLDIVVTAEMDAELAQRIHAKLHKQMDLTSVDLIEGRLAGAAASPAMG